MTAHRVHHGPHRQGHIHRAVATPAPSLRGVATAGPAGERSGSDGTGAGSMSPIPLGTTALQRLTSGSPPLAPPVQPPGTGWSRPGPSTPPAGGRSVADLDPVIVEHWQRFGRLFPSDVHQIFAGRDPADVDPLGGYVNKLRAVTT